MKAAPELDHRLFERRPTSVDRLACAGMSAGYTTSIVKIAVSIPEDVFAAADAEAARRGLSRSAFYTVALRRTVTNRTALDEAIVAGYREHPQDADIDVDALPSLAEDLGAYPS